MFEYKDVSAKEIMCKYENTRFGQLCFLSHVRNLEDIYKLYLTFEGKDKVKLDRDFHEFERRKRSVILAGSEAELYDIDLYPSEDLCLSDKLNKGSVLLLDTPTAQIPVKKYSTVKRETLFDIKDDLTHAAINGHNYLRQWYDGIGKTDMPNIVEAVNMYTAQIIRQSYLTDKRNINLFDLDRKERELLITRKIRDIIIWLVQNEKNGFVWGHMNDHRKALYLSAVNYEKDSDKKLRSLIASYIANYVTLEEAEELSHGKEKVLERFLK